MRRWGHLHSLALGAAGWAVAEGRWWSYLIVFACGLAAGICTLALWRLLRRLGRIGGALERRIVAPPLSEDEDYLGGIERGIRSARRSAGHEDGRLAELDRLNDRSLA